MGKGSLEQNRMRAACRQKPLSKPRHGKACSIEKEAAAQGVSDLRVWGPQRVNSLGRSPMKGGIKAWKDCFHQVKKKTFILEERETYSPGICNGLKGMAF